jgi:hypothetical protein
MQSKLHWYQCLDRGDRRGCERFRFSRRSLSSNSRMICRVSVCICSASCSSAASAHISCHLSLVWFGAIRIPFKKKMFSRLGCTVFSTLLLDSKPCLSNTEHSGGKPPMCGFCQRQSRAPGPAFQKASSAAPMSTIAQTVDRSREYPTLSMYHIRDFRQRGHLRTLYQSQLSQQRR